MIVNCWQHTGILPLNDEEPSGNRAYTAEPDVEFEVQEATNTLEQLNLALSNQEGSRHLLPKLCLVDDIEEPKAPEWAEEDISEIELLEMPHEMDDIDDDHMNASLQEPSMKVSFSAINTLYDLALFNAHEPEFSNLLCTLSNVYHAPK